MKKSILKYLIIFTVFQSCTDLEPVVYSEIVNENFFQTEKQVLTAAGPAYQSLNAYTNPECFWGMNEMTTDEILLPTRGKHWYNNGIFYRFHNHEWIPTEGFFNNAWKISYAGINNCNRVIYLYDNIINETENISADQLNALTSVQKELKALRAFYYFLLMDAFGNVPIVDKYDLPDGFAPTNSSRADVFQFIEDEILANISSLNGATDGSTYARFHRYVAYTLLAKLYLNADVYIGQPMLDEAIEACDSVITYGNYTLETDYFGNFAIKNENSKENIFVIPFSNNDDPFWGDDIYPARMFQHYLWTLHFSGGQKYNTEQGCWGGFCALPSHYEMFDETDIRRDMWLTGAQYSYTGEPLFCTEEKVGEPLIYTVEISSFEGAAENEGARLAKYDYTGASNFQLENDYVLFRYADVLLMKAEAIMRKNGGTPIQEALDLVNQIRERAFPADNTKLYTAGTLNLDELLNERSRELAGEGWRRNDLIRFGKFNDAVGFRTSPAPATYNLFPIPQDQINANPNLVQNPGY